MPGDELNPLGQNTGACEAQDGDGGGAGGERRKRKLGSAVTKEGDGAEVRPYPGLVDRLESLLSEDDQITTVSCGARYTLALSRKKRAYVWGQVAPCLDGDREGGGGGPSSFARPRQLHPAELLRAAREKASSFEKERCFCNCSHREGGGPSVDGGSEDKRRGVEGEGSLRWSVCAAGCGPWYAVLGLQEERGQL